MRFTVLIVLLTASAWLMAVNCSALDLSGYRNEIPPKPCLIKMKNPGFDKGSKGWSLGKGFSVKKAAGINGSPALYCERNSKDVYSLAIQRIVLKPGRRYSFGAWIKCQDVEGTDSGATISLEFKNGTTHLGGYYTEGIKGTCDWTWISDEVRIPEDAEHCEVIVYIRNHMTGRAWFDDVRIEDVTGKTVDIYQVYPTHQSLADIGGEIRIKANFESEKKRALFRRYVVVLSADIAGKTVETKGRFITSYGVIQGSFGALPVGKGGLKVTVLDPARKTIVVERRLPFTVRPVETDLPAGACTVGRDGRAYVDGKPFLPVGIVNGRISPKVLKRLAASPFNCVMLYDSIHLNHGKPENASAKAVRKVLDLCADNGLKVIFSVKDLYEDSRYGVPGWLESETKDMVVEKVIREFRTHRALLAWYINDEAPLKMRGVIEKRRQLINSLDYAHPTWCCLCDFSDVPLFGSTCDIMGVDPYPLTDYNRTEMRKVKVAMDESNSTGMSTWVIPQFHNRGVYAERSEKGAYGRFPEPTEEQIRAMCLYMAMRGAKGFVGFSYYALTLPPLTGADFERRWPGICRVAQALRDLEPYLLSDTPSTPVKVTASRGEVYARRFVAKDGSERILIAGIGPRESKAGVFLAENVEYRSIYGLSEKKSTGLYVFSGKDLCSDILVVDKP